MKICYWMKADPYFESLLKDLQAKHSELEVVYQYNLKSWDFKDADILICGVFTAADIAEAKNLKSIILPFTGVNNLPLAYLKERKITLVNAHAHGKIVAERAFALSLALLGKIVSQHELMESGVWHGFFGDVNLNWTTLRNKRCGFIGMGEIGQNIVKYLEPFSGEIVTLKRYEPRCSGLHAVTYYNSVEEVCLNSDVVYVSLPLTKTTKDLISKDILLKMKDKYIVNVGRGDVISEEGLYESLKNQILKGAAIDVWYQYPVTNSPVAFSQYPFHTLDNIILSPHSAGHEETSRKAVALEIISNLEHFLNEKAFIHTVNYDTEY